MPRAIHNDSYIDIVDDWLIDVLIAPFPIDDIVSVTASTSW